MLCAAHNKRKREEWVPVLLLMVVTVMAGCDAQLQTAHVELARLPPSATWWLGTDTLGRSVAVQLIAGLRNSLSVAVLAVAINLTNGLWIGYLAGRTEGILGQLMTRFIDLCLALPSLLFALLLVAMLGASYGHLILAFTVLGWTGYARVVRGEVRRVNQAEFVLAARSMGVPEFRLARVYIVPQLVPILLVQSTFSLGAVILGESTLSFLGLGDPTLASLGKQLSEGVDYMREAPHLTLLPGAVLACMILAANLLGDKLQDRFSRG